MTASERLAWLRQGPRTELLSVALFVLALALGALHWAGLVVGGALVGFVAPSLRRAVVMGVYLGSVTVFLFAGWLLFNGVLGKAVATGQLFVLTVAVGFLFPVFGSTVRGLL